MVQGGRKRQNRSVSVPISLFGMIPFPACLLTVQCLFESLLGTIEGKHAYQVPRGRRRAE